MVNVVDVLSGNMLVPSVSSNRLTRRSSPNILPVDPATAISKLAGAASQTLDKVINNPVVKLSRALGENHIDLQRSMNPSLISMNNAGSAPTTSKKQLKADTAIIQAEIDRLRNSPTTNAIARDPNSSLNKRIEQLRSMVDYNSSLKKKYFPKTKVVDQTPKQHRIDSQIRGKEIEINPPTGPPTGRKKLSHGNPKGNRGRRGKKNKGGVVMHRQANMTKSNMTSDHVKSMPVATSLTFLSNTTMVEQGKAQKMTDKGSITDNVRVHFNDYTAYSITSGGLGFESYGFSTGANRYALQVSPSGMSPRLVQYEELYSWYAFRELRFTYVPRTPTSLAASVGVNIGVIDNPDAIGNFAPPTRQQINECEISLNTIAWQPSEFVYKFNGSKLWATTASGTVTSEFSEYWQAFLLCILDGAPVVTNNYGQLRVDGVIDFYNSTPPSPTLPSLMLFNRLRCLNNLNQKTYIERCMFSLIEYLRCVEAGQDVFVSFCRQSPGLMFDPDVLTQKQTDDERESRSRLCAALSFLPSSLASKSSSSTVTSSLGSYVLVDPKKPVM